MTAADGSLMLLPPGSSGGILLDLSVFECERMRVVQSPSEFDFGRAPFPNSFYGLIPRRICELNPLNVGKITSGVSGWSRV